MNLRDALAAALRNDWPCICTPAFTARHLSDPACAHHDPVYDADAILADPTFRSALTEAVAEALDDHDHYWDNIGGESDFPGIVLRIRRDHLAPYTGLTCPAAIVARMVGDER